jgi:hypothetical protein
MQNGTKEFPLRYCVLFATSGRAPLRSRGKETAPSLGVQTKAVIHRMRLGLASGSFQTCVGSIRTPGTFGPIEIAVPRAPRLRR